MSSFGILVGIGIVGAFFLFIVITKLMYICQPSEVLIFSGAKRRLADGRVMGYQIIKGGRRIRRPLVEVVDRMDLTNMPIELAVSGAYSKGGIPLNVHGIANVKIAGEQPMLDNAIERFLGVERGRIMAVAKETLEGNLRGVLATLTPEEVNADKIKFAQSLLNEAEDDLRHIGLELDTLKIQDVSDEVNYLDSIGRKQSAEVLKRATIAEARNKSDSALQSADNRKQTEISRLDAQLGTLRADMARRITDAETKQVAMVAEAKGDVAAKLARAQAELDVQRARVEQVRRQLQADVLEPARAQKTAAEAQAKGEAANIVEQGRATAAAMQEIATTWRRVGDNARQVFLMQKVDQLMRIVMSTAGDLKVDHLTVLGSGGDGDNGTDLARRLIGLGEQLKAATGVDVVGTLRDRLASMVPPAAPPRAVRTPAAAHPASTAPTPAAAPFPPAKT
jgi:flotillin